MSDVRLSERSVGPVQLLLLPPDTPVVLTPITGIDIAAVCDMRWYGVFSAYYASLAVSCVGPLITQAYQDPINGQNTTWTLCEAHADILCYCHGCGLEISPYNALHICRYCMVSEP